MSASASGRTGRPKGAHQKITTRARIEAEKTGMLPHMWLLMVARGEPIPHKYYVEKIDGRKKSRVLVEETFYADFQTRVDAAKAAAPYFAPKLSAQTLDVPNTIGHKEKSAKTKEDVLNELKKRGLPTSILSKIGKELLGESA